MAAALVILLPLLAVEPRAAAASPAVRCATAKLKAAAKKHGAKVRCHVQAILARKAVDPACLAAAEAKFSAAFARSEAAGGCFTSGDAPAVEDAVDDCVRTLVGLLPTSATTTTSSTTTTTQPNFSCSPPGTPCGHCGCGFCFAPQGYTTGICVVPYAGGSSCSIDPPTDCPPGQMCVVTSFDPAMFTCAVPCP